MTAYETKKIIYETIVKEIYINPETAHALTEVIYKNLKDAEQGVYPTYGTLPASEVYTTPDDLSAPVVRLDPPISG